MVGWEGGGGGSGGRVTDGDRVVFCFLEQDGEAMELFFFFFFLQYRPI